MIDEPLKDIAFIVLAETQQRLDNLLPEARKTARDSVSWLRWQTRGYEIPDAKVYGLLVDDTSRFSLAGPWGELLPRLPENEHTYYCLMNVSAGGAGGRAYPNTDKLVVANAGDLRITIHEKGHAMFNGQHYVVGPLDQNPDNYGGPGVLGTGNQLGATYMHNAKLYPEEWIAHGNGHYFLSEASSHYVLPGEKKIAYLEREYEGRRRIYAVSYMNGRVRIDTHRGTFADKIPFRGAHAIASLTPGQSWENVKFQEKWEGTAEIWVGQSLSIAPPAVKLTDPTAFQVGHFHNDATHQGLQVFERNGHAYIALFTHDAAGPHWFVGDGPIKNNVAYITLYSVDAKTREKEIVEVGSGVLYFTDANTGEFLFHVDHDWTWPGRIRMPLTRLIDPIEQRYYDLGGNEGVSLHTTPDTEVIVWWTYEFNFNPNPVWYYGENGVLYLAQHGMPNTVTQSTAERWGEYELGETFRYKRDTWADWKSKTMGRLV